MKIHRNLFLRLTCPVIFGATILAQEKITPANNTLPYRNPNLAIEDRVADLLSRMTLEEKVEQVCGGGEQKVSVIDPTGTFTNLTARATLARWWDPDQAFPPKRAAILRNAVQRYLREKTRLGIPSCSWEKRCTASWNTAAQVSRRQLGSLARGTRRW